jgi:hypothetical protein
MTESTDTKPLLGRCKEKGCDYALFATDADVKPGESLRDVKAGQGAYRVNNGFVARCTNSHKVFPLQRIKGTYSADHKCDARCLNAKGHTCTCSCGGMNHGRGHVGGTVVVAANVVERQADSGHVGEVGKHITGEVFVRQVAYDRRPYSFTTVNGGAEIVWFVPEMYDPHFEQGSRIKIRAKVKEHVTHERFGRSTIVIYVEKIED